MMAFIQKSEKMINQFKAEKGVCFNSIESKEDIYMEDIVNFNMESSTQSKESPINCR